ncbi:MAG: SDR family NAD(P)-dependent oxidoreductase [Geminicoccales bacterium]
MSRKPKTAIVTGASGGLGKAIAEAFVGNGYNVVVSGTNAERLTETMAEIGVPDRAVAIVADITRPEDRKKIVHAAIDHFGRVDVLVNNAGVFEPRPFLDVDEAHLDRFLDINLKGTFFLTQEVVPHFHRVGGGSVVNVGTVLVDHAIGGVPATAPISSKGAIHALTGQLAAEFGSKNIRFNTIAPGIIRSPMHERNGIEDADSLGGLHLLSRIGEPSEIANAALLLAESDFITGTVINVDGGHVAGHAIN